MDDALPTAELSEWAQQINGVADELHATNGSYPLILRERIARQLYVDGPDGRPVAGPLQQLATALNQQRQSASNPADRDRVERVYLAVCGALRSLGEAMRCFTGDNRPQPAEIAARLRAAARALSSGPVPAAAPRTEAVQLDKIELAVLACLAKPGVPPLTQAEILAEIHQTVRSKDALGPRLKHLRELGLIDRPCGKRKGEAITTAGASRAHIGR